MTVVMSEQTIKGGCVYVRSMQKAVVNVVASYFCIVSIVDLVRFQSNTIIIIIIIYSHCMLHVVLITLDLLYLFTSWLLFIAIASQSFSLETIQIKSSYWWLNIEICFCRCCHSFDLLLYNLFPYTIMSMYVIWLLLLLLCICNRTFL